MDVSQAKMTEFIKNNTFTTAHVATEVVCLAGLLYYTVQSNRQLNKTIQALESRLKNCENIIHQQNSKINQMQSMDLKLSHPQKVSNQQAVKQRQQQPPRQQILQQQQQQSYQQPLQFNSPAPKQRLPVIYEEHTPTISQYDEDDAGVPEITEEELDNEINEELGKLVDFATEA